MNYTIEFVDKISHAEEERMTKDLVAYESAHESDLLVDGSLALQEQEKQVLNALSLFEEKVSDKNE